MFGALSGISVSPSSKVNASLAALAGALPLPVGAADSVGAFTIYSTSGLLAETRDSGHWP